MIDILWHGRGGQGAFTAARLLGAAGSLSPGRYALAFPSFGPERRGAPMRAFTKLDGAPIGDRSAVSRADFVVYLDDTLFSRAVACELKPGAVVLVNTVHPSDDPRVIAIDASGIAAAHLGRPIPNTALLAALCTLCDDVAVEDVKRAIALYMPAKLHAGNIAVVDDVVQRMSRMRASGGFACRVVGCEEPRGGALPGRDADGAPSVDPGRRFSRPQACIPTLRSGELDPQSFARATCFEAGYLVAKNAGWRNVRPVIDPHACISCSNCLMYCPDGAIFDPRPAAGDGLCGAEAGPGEAVAVDYDFCKGCGICANLCPAHAIAMVSEARALDAEAQRAEQCESEAGAR